MAPRRRVLITGANGYIAAQTVARFLSAGWAVRGTVRDLSSPTATSLASHFASAQAEGTFELVVVRDIKAPRAFDAAVRGVQAIAHLATPVVFDSGDVEYIIGTAVQGTLSILESALKATAAASARDEGEDGSGIGGSLGSFVMMSSVSAVRMNLPGPVTFTEKDWNTQAEADVREAGDKAFGHVIYAASKVASERAFWKWVEEKKPPFAATVLCPCWVAGPPAYPPSSPEDLAETTSFIWKVFSGQDFPPGPSGYGTHVDVRDVARMTEWAASHPEIAGGERYVVGGNGNVGVPQAAADILRQAYPERRGIIKEGTPGAGYQPGYAVEPKGVYMDSTKAVKATGQDWIPYDKMVLDAAKSFEVYL
ncbi:NAD dependent epimerase/dehydratase [Xylaria arbuscula]|nr:NAD dependent epimerase/dehydratase [Xylaria arbuscula]